MGFIRRLLSHKSARVEAPEPPDFDQTQQFVTLASQTRETNKTLAAETDRLKKLLDRLKDNG
jgi:hypothetical protein